MACATPEPGPFGLPWFPVTLPAGSGAVRSAAEQGIARAQHAYGTMKAAGERTAAAMEASMAATAGGSCAYVGKLIETTRHNTNAVFDFWTALLGSRSLAEATHVSTAHASRQFTACQAQARELGTLAQSTLRAATAPLTGLVAGRDGAASA